MAAHSSTIQHEVRVRRGRVPIWPNSGEYARERPSSSFSHGMASEVTQTQRDKTVVTDDASEFEWAVDQWAFEHPKEARIQSMRAILQKFDTKVYAFPDRIEVRGMIPTEMIRLPAEATRGKRGQEFNSAYGTHRSTTTNKVPTQKSL